MKKKKKILNGILIGMSCLLATGIVLSVTNVFDIESIEDSKEEKDEIKTWKGTAVPTNGFVETIYLNTNLSDSEVYEYYNLIKPYLNSEQSYYVFYNYSDFEYMLGFVGLDDSFAIVDTNFEHVFYTNSVEDFSSLGVTNNGWQGLDSITFNKEAFSKKDNFDVGQINEELKGLFSITPFVYE